MTNDEMTVRMAGTLRTLARAAYKRHGVHLAIVEPLGDVPHIPVNAYEIVADPRSNGQFDIWSREPHTIVRPDVSMEELLSLLPGEPANAG